jgi:hypothetical protein
VNKFVKKLSITMFFVAATILFSLLPQSTDAGKSVFGKKTDDEIEKAKQINLEILSQLSKMQWLNVSDSLVVQKVEIDELGMAHTSLTIPLQNVSNLLINFDASLFNQIDLGKNNNL